jgi:hypothetical protein
MAVAGKDLYDSRFPSIIVALRKIHPVVTGGQTARRVNFYGQAVNRPKQSGVKSRLASVPARRSLLSF